MSKKEYIALLPTLQERLLYLEETDSTNIVAKSLAAQDKIGAVVIAGAQTKGRGRLGRAFISPAGGGLYLSIVLPGPTEWAIAPTILAGACVCKAITKIIGKEAQVKWVNDLIVERHKVGGILAEATETAVIMGIGINVNTPQSCFDASMPHVSSLSVLEQRPFSVAKTGVAIIEELDTLLENRGDPAYIATLVQYYRDHLITLGQEVRVTDSKGIRIGKAEDLLENGTLLVRFEGYQEAIEFGDVSVRSKHGYI